MFLSLGFGIAANKFSNIIIKFNSIQKRFIYYGVRRSINMDLAKSYSKPPSVLVYTSGNNDIIAKNIVYNLRSCLNMDKYVICPLTKQEVLNSPWTDSAALLVVHSDDFTECVDQALVNFLKESGKVLMCCSNFQHPEIHLKCNLLEENTKCYIKTHDMFILRGQYSYVSEFTKDILTDSLGQCVIKKSTEFDNLILSELHLALDENILIANEQLDSGTDKRHKLLQKLLSESFGLDVLTSTLLEPSCGYVIAESHKLSDMKHLIPLKEISLGQNTSHTNVKKPSELKVPLLFSNEKSDSISFDQNAYFSALKSKIFGRTVVYFPVVTSTMIPIQSLSNINGIVVAASHQISSCGRSNNVWLSPKGSASFTINISLKLSSRLGQRMSVLQHMASLAVVHGLRKIPLYNNLQLKLKWPNDLYYGREKKIGGVLVNSTIQGDSVHAFVGIGVNISNPHPTVCINSVIKEISASGKSLPLLKVEEVIARTVTELEYIIDKFENSGTDEFLSLYYSYWLHSSQAVHIKAINEEATISGIDDFGFLIVQTGSGRQMTLQPDGNRFDIMKNLIISKESFI